VYIELVEFGHAKVLERLVDTEIRKRLKAHIIMTLTGHQDYHREHVLHAAEISERSYTRYKALIKKEELLAGKPCEYRRLCPPLGSILDNIAPETSGWKPLTASFAEYLSMV